MNASASATSSERFRAAITNSGLVHPRARLTVNLAPADLPIVVGLLLTTEQVGADVSNAGEAALFQGLPVYAPE